MTNKFLDKICVKYFIRKNNFIETNRIRSLDKYWPNLRDYMKTRYKDIIEFKTFAEVLYRMKYHIENRTLCNVCGKPTPFMGLKHYLLYGDLYQKHCCSKCAANDSDTIKAHENFWINKIGLKHPWCKGSEIAKKNKQILLERYGVDNVMKSKKIRNKRDKTMLEKYGAKSAWQSTILKEKIKNTMIEKYGAEYPLQSKILREKIEQTNLERYGVKNPLNLNEFREKAKETLLKKYGVDNILKLPEIVEYSHSKEVLEKIANTKRKHHTFNTSKPEETLYKILVDLYDIDNVKRQYKSELYPWHCDFYITSINTYIEVQGYYTHGKHPFNEEKDKEELNKLKEKYKPYYEKYGKYPQRITIWSISDVNKRNTAIKNNLNYIEIFNCEEISEIKDFLLQYKGGYVVY